MPSHRIRRSRHRERFIPLRSPPQAAQLWLLLVFFLPGWVVAATAVLFSALAHQYAEGWLTTVGFAGLVAIWLPSQMVAPLGALVMTPSPQGRRLTQALIPLVLVMLVPMVGLLLTPWLAALLLLPILVWRFGQADLHALLALARAEHLVLEWQRVLAIVARGCLPFAVALNFHTVGLLQLLQDLCALTRHTVPEWLPALFEPWPVLPVTLACYALVFVHLLWGIAASARKGLNGWQFDASEVLLVIFLFAAVSPMVAFPLYLGWVHGPRQWARWMLFDDRTAQLLADGRQAAALARGGLLLLGPALVLLGVVAAMFLADPTDLVPHSVGLLTVLVLVLSVGNWWAGLAMERREGLWRPAPEDD